MTPLELGICLHYHSRVDDVPWIDSGAPIVDGVMKQLVADELLTQNEPSLETDCRRFLPTNKLHAFVDMLCQTPLPIECFCDPRDNTLIKYT